MKAARNEAGLYVVAGSSFTREAMVGNGQAVSRTPCHDRKVRVDGELAGADVVVRCPTCSRLWEVRFPPRGTTPMFALWVA